MHPWVPAFWYLVTPSHSGWWWWDSDTKALSQGCGLEMYCLGLKASTVYQLGALEQAASLLLFLFPGLWKMETMIASTSGSFIFIVEIKWDKVQNASWLTENKSMINDSFQIIKTFIFYWSIIALQCCVILCCTTKWISYMYTYIPPSLTSFPPPTPIPQQPGHENVYWRMNG